MTKDDEKEKKESNWSKFGPNIVNSLIFAIVLIWITSIFNNRTEKIKVEETFASEFNKIRVQKLGDCWAELNELDAQIDILMYQYRTYTSKPTKRDSIQLSNLLKETSGYEKLYIIERNRFWIDKKQYKILEEFALLVARKQENYLIFNQDSINIINKLIHQKRVEADGILIEMLDKD